MKLDISQRQHEGIDLLDLHGRLVLGEEDLQLENAVESLLEQGRSRLVLNLAELVELDTCGLETLLCAQQKLQKAGGNLALTQLRPAHLDLLVLAKLETAFQVFASEQDAIDSFFPDRQACRYDILELVRSQKPLPQKVWS